MVFTPNRARNTGSRIMNRISDIWPKVITSSELAMFEAARKSFVRA